MTELSKADKSFLQHAIDLSSRALKDHGKTPFGAIVVVDEQVVGEGTSTVIELLDPSAHAEIMALRNAATKLQRHLIPDGTLYSSCEPCPMCLTACYWARIPRVVFGATSYDVATYGFEDLQLYRELAQPSDQRSLREDQADQSLRSEAADILRAWAEALPHPIEPKY